MTIKEVAINQRKPDFYSSISSKSGIEIKSE